jgi:hypothetical protein
VLVNDFLYVQADIPPGLTIQQWRARHATPRRDNALVRIVRWVRGAGR